MISKGVLPLNTVFFRRTRRLVRALPSLSCLVLLFYYFSPTAAIASLFAILLHEVGHAAVYFAVTHTPPRFSFQSGGLCLSGAALDGKAELLYIAAGILANCVTALFSPFVGLLFGDAAARLFFAYSLLYAAFNLLPSPPLDGEKLLSRILAHAVGEARATRALRILSFLTAYTLLLLSLFLSLGNGSCFYGVFLALRLLYAIFYTS